MTVDGRRAAAVRPARRASCTIRLAVSRWPPGAGVALDVRYVGHARVRRVGTWGEVGWEELTDGVIVAGQPDGAPSWFPCNDHPSDKASFRIAVTTESALPRRGQRHADRARS